MTNRQAYNEFILDKQLADLSPKSIKDYSLFIEPFIKYLGFDNNIEDIQQSDISDYIHIILGKNISKATRSTYIRNIKIYLKWLNDNYVQNIQYDYKRVKVPRNPKKNVHIYSDDEIMEIFDTIHAESEWIINRNKCIIALMYDSGLRQSEVCSLKTKWVQPKEGRLKVRGKGSKERTVPLGKLTAYYMKLYQEECPYNTDMLFVNRRGQELTCNAVKLLVNRLSKDLGFELSSHKLRHNFATNYCIDQYEKRGMVDIYKLMILMGHEDIETTKRYLHHANEIIGVNNHISHLDRILKREN